MPPLVDGPAGAGAPPPNGWGPAGYPYTGTPYMTYTPAPGTPGQPHHNHTPSSPPWPPHPSTPFPHPAANALLTPLSYPPMFNPAMPTGSDGFPRAMQRDEADYRNSSGYFSKPDDDGWVSVRSARSVTPFTNNSSPESRSSGLSRSRSVRSVGSGDSMRPPREWRPDFSMAKSLHRGALGTILTKARSASISGGILDSTRHPKLHPYLRYSLSTPVLFHDLRRNPSTIRFHALNRPVNPWDLTRFACEPPQTHMRLYNSHYPWYIDAESANPTGVTLHELFAAIWLSMMTPISNADYWNNEMNGEVRERIAAAWFARCEDDGERKRGVRRVDFLMDRVILEGFVRGKDGMWEMTIKRPT